MLEFGCSCLPIPKRTNASVKYILVFMLLVLLVGCKKSNDTSQESTLPNQSEAVKPEPMIEEEALTSSIDLSTYHQCWGALIEGSKDGLSIYAVGIKDCRKGNIVIAYQEFLRRENGKAIYNITDTMSMKNSEGIEAYLTTCNQNGERGTYFLLINDDLSQEFFTGVNKAWQANTNSKQLVSVHPENLKCINMDYGAQ